MTLRTRGGDGEHDGALRGVVGSAPWVAGQLREWLRPREAEMLEAVRTLVEIDSPTEDIERLNATLPLLENWFSDLGTLSEHRPDPDGPAHVLIEIGQPGNGRAPLVLCHYDTVWPAGTTAAWRFECADGWASGPGILDMKSSIVLVHRALLGLRALEVGLDAGVRVLLTGDEETGNRSSRGLIRGLARTSGAALVLEPALPDGRLKTQRKGHANITIEIEGRRAHAGVEPEKGVNAAIEAARVALLADSLGNGELGTVINVGVIRSGERANVVAGSALLELEVRSDREQEIDRVIRELRGLRPSLSDSRIVVSADLDRPTMPRVSQTDELLALARAAGQGLGMEIGEGSTGGGSEGNFTQEVGTPTLDGMGPVGVGAHSRSERIELASLFDRTALLAAVLASLQRSDRRSPP